MKDNSPAVLLRIYISSTDKINNQILYESLVFKAKEMGLAGATVTKGILGFGASSIIHSYKFWEVSDKLPVVIEVVDEQRKIDTFYETILPIIQSMRYGCLITRQEVDVLLYKPGEKK